MNCSIEGCYRTRKKGKYCSMHAARRYQGRDMTAPPQRQFHGLSTQDRFEQWIVKEAGSGCWMWTGSLNKAGYGQFNFTGKRPMPAHRAAYLIYRGEIPASEHSAYGTMYVLHHCDMPQCVNPQHLYLGTQKDNSADAVRRHRLRPGHVQGEQHGMAKLTEELVTLIRTSTVRGSVLAQQLGVSDTTIYDVRHGKIWRHVVIPESGEQRIMDTQNLEFPTYAFRPDAEPVRVENQEEWDTLAAEHPDLRNYPYLAEEVAERAARRTSDSGPGQEPDKEAPPQEPDKESPPRSRR